MLSRLTGIVPERLIPYFIGGLFGACVLIATYIVGSMHGHDSAVQEYETAKIKERERIRAVVENALIEANIAEDGLREGARNRDDIIDGILEKLEDDPNSDRLAIDPSFVHELDKLQ